MRPLQFALYSMIALLSIPFPYISAEESAKGYGIAITSTELRQLCPESRRHDGSHPIEAR
jgi:hypothetical protein